MTGRAAESRPAGIDWDALLVDALRAGIGIEEFWRLTPVETVMSIEAAVWRANHEQRARAWLAWHVAALSRARKLPPLRRLLREPRRALSEHELAERDREHEAAARRLERDLAAGAVPLPGKHVSRGERDGRTS